MLKERGTKGEGEGEGRRSEKEWSVINLIKKLNARARRVVGKWIDHGLALGVLPCLASAGQKQQRKENGKWKERKKEEKERNMGEGENGRRKKGQRQRKRRERGKVEKKRENRDRCIRRRVSQIRNLLTMVRKAIHLDDRGESVIYWPVTPAPTWATTILSIYIYIYDAPRGQWSSSPEKEKGPCPFVIIIPFPLSLSPHRHDGCTIIYIASELSK